MDRTTHQVMGAFIALAIYFAFWAVLTIGALAVATWIVIKVLQWTGVL